MFALPLFLTIVSSWCTISNNVDVMSVICYFCGEILALSYQKLLKYVIFIFVNDTVQTNSANDNFLNGYSYEISIMNEIFFRLTLSWQRPLSYRNQSIDLLWFLYYNGTRHERVKSVFLIPWLQVWFLLQSFFFIVKLIMKFKLKYKFYIL